MISLRSATSSSAAADSGKPARLASRAHFTFRAWRICRVALLLAWGLTGCAEPTAPYPASLIGQWHTEPEVNRFDGTISSSSLIMRGEGSYLRGWLLQDPSGSIRAGVNVEGTYAVRGDSIFMHSTLVKSWDRDFNGGAVSITPTNGNGPYGAGGVRYEFRSDTLALHYLSYPADAPVETSEVFLRSIPVDVVVR